jgi:hypothetical protein
MAAWVALVGCLISTVSAQAAPANATAFFREGQTFLTWQEDNAVTGEWYHVYASAQPITANNLSHAQRVAKIPEGSRRFQFLRNVDIQSNSFWTNLVQQPWYEAIQIQDDENGAQRLAAGTGLFVRTIHAPASTYYAVTVESNGVEDRSTVAATATAVVESVGTPGAVMQMKLGDRHYLYAFFADYEVWNPDGIEDNWEGYVHVFQIRAPAANAAGAQQPYPTAMRLHAYTAWNDWNITACSPPTHINVRQLDYHLTWWYGYSAVSCRWRAGLPPDQPISPSPSIRTGLLSSAVPWAAPAHTPSAHAMATSSPRPSPTREFKTGAWKGAGIDGPGTSPTNGGPAPRPIHPGTAFRCMTRSIRPNRRLSTRSGKRRSSISARASSIM